VPALSRSHPSVAVWLLNCGLLNNAPNDVPADRLPYGVCHELEVRGARAAFICPVFKDQ
jgi:hypothetical protein